MKNARGGGKRVNLIMIGPPGAGKGTQAERIAHERSVPRISTGDILREAIQQGTPLGLRAKAIVERGDLVSDEVMIGVVRERLERPDTRRGFVLDGFPRTVPQAEALDEMLDGRGPLIIVEMVVPAEELDKRMTARRICRNCGTNAEPADKKCSRCGGEIVARADDGQAAIRTRRQGVYTSQTKPILDYYRARPTFRTINGAQPPDQVSAALTAAIDAALETAASSR
ncbi:MAG TPA: adenylate kinase [Vicinamibacterales bacterium]|jgi:adenylate kinase